VNITDKTKSKIYLEDLIFSPLGLNVYAIKTNMNPLTPTSIPMFTSRNQGPYQHLIPPLTSFELLRPWDQIKKLNGLPKYLLYILPQLLYLQRHNPLDILIFFFIYHAPFFLPYYMMALLLS
jgi:hypothetical protein